MRKMVIDNSRINILASNRDLLQKFPFLGRKVETQCCGGRRQLTPDYDGIRSAIASLPEETRKQFKMAIGCSAVSVFVKDQGRAREVNI